MRIKQDFVTNSSTTSFVVWGKMLDQRDLQKNEKLVKTAYDRFVEKGYNRNNLTFEEFKENERFHDLFDQLSYLTKLDTSMGPCGDDFWIGGVVDGIKLDQTLREYQQEIVDELNRLGFTTNSVDELGFICEAWRDG